MEDVSKKVEKLQKLFSRSKKVPDFYRAQLAESAAAIHGEQAAKLGLITAKEKAERIAYHQMRIKMNKEENIDAEIKLRVELAGKRAELDTLKDTAISDSTVASHTFQVGGAILIVDAARRLIGVWRESDVSISRPTAVDNVDYLYSALIEAPAQELK